MPRRFFNRILPTHADLKARWYLRPFDALLHDPALWATHRKSVVRAFALGLFVAFLPVPGQALIVVAAAVWMRVNVPVALIAMLVVNPFTMVPAFFAAYWVGVVLLRVDYPIDEETFSTLLTWDTFADTLLPIWKPLFLGSFVLATFVATAGYSALNLLWRVSLTYRFRKRRRNRAN